ncbi:low-density lipoprotein receptor class A domain-containing protein 3 isoform X7 [Caretta caretta]|uniref:low-density lipoprotein receptor class A domain-containing protein 3 isoform X7 n=2 Tax=Caretta caretta TaxID=8467 RepID=UPI003F4C84B1
MRKGTFMELCDLLSPALRHKNTKMRAPLTIEKRVAIALWELATPDSYRSVGNQFGVDKSTMGAAVMQVANAIKDLLILRVVTLGNVQVIVDGFAAMGFPNCGGAIDRTHIPVLAPEHQASKYINRKGYFSVVLQALMDHKGCFTSINVGWPGKRASCCLGITSQMNATFLETSCVVTDAVSQGPGSVMGCQTASMKVTRRNAQKPNPNVAPRSSPVLVGSIVSLAASGAMALRTVQMAAMKKIVQQIPCCALLPDSTVRTAFASIKALYATVKITARTTVMKKAVKALKKLAVAKSM